MSYVKKWYEKLPIKIPCEYETRNLTLEEYVLLTKFHPQNKFVEIEGVNGEKSKKKNDQNKDEMKNGK